MNPLQAL